MKRYIFCLYFSLEIIHPLLLSVRTTFVGCDYFKIHVTLPLVNVCMSKNGILNKFNIIIILINLLYLLQWNLKLFRSCQKLKKHYWLDALLQNYPFIPEQGKLKQVFAFECTFIQWNHHKWCCGSILVMPFSFRKTSYV